jgi:hypothetical protein
MDADPAPLSPAPPLSEGPGGKQLMKSSEMTGVLPDPTVDWPDQGESTPDFDWSTLSFGPLRFGDPVDRAAAFGRPDTFRWTQPGYCELVYARSGFLLQFDRGGFAYVAWLIGPDPRRPDVDDARYSTPSLDGELTLTARTRSDTIRARLGEPLSEDAATADSVLIYAGEGVVLEFEFDAEGSLKRWNVYPEKG